MGRVRIEERGPRLCGGGRRWFAVTVAVIALGTSGEPAGGATLTDLFAGALLVVGNAQFSDWHLVALDATATAPNLALINVNPLIDTPPLHPGIQFSAGSQLATLGVNSIDLHLSFRVTAVGSSSFVDQTLAMTGVTFNGSGGIMFVSADMTAAATGVSLSTSVAMADNETKFFHFSDTASFAHKPEVAVAMNVFLTGLAGSDDSSLSTFTQRFSQTGPAGVAGDYNDDGIVNAADYTVYRNRQAGIGGTALANEGVTLGMVTVDDFNFWKARYGSTSGSGASVFDALASVPEPATLLLCVFAALTWTSRRMRSRGGRAARPVR